MSRIGDRYSFSGPMLICITSVAHLRFGADAAKSQLMMFGAMRPTSPLYVNSIIRAGSPAKLMLSTSEYPIKGRLSAFGRVFAYIDKSTNILYWEIKFMT